LRAAFPGRAWVVAALVAALPSLAPAQDIRQDRERGREMLRDIQSLLKRHYYDPAFGGRDLDARFAAAEEKMRTATTEAMISGIIAQALVELDDSHTFFIPPPPPREVEYGWRVLMVRDRCLVVAVRPGSDAEARGVRPGMTVLEIAGLRPERSSLWKIDYLLNVLRPRDAVPLKLRDLRGQLLEVTVKAAITPRSRFVTFENYLDEERRRRGKERPNRFADLGQVLVWKLGWFDDEERVVDEGIRRTRGRKAVVLDLRGNPGGALETLERLAGSFFEQPVAIAELRGRKDKETVRSDRRGGDDVFKGALTVLVDSDSGSAAEIFARLVQLQERGPVLGDRTAGAVMASRNHVLTQGHEARFLAYAVSVTGWDTVMPDGGHLEKVGVTPDEVLVPSPEDLAAGRDPVLAAAVERAGATITPEAAAALSKREWNGR
jgi:carboxyl-terminal processing protease